MSTTEPTREERLAVIREREQQATKGPWESHACFDSTGYPVYSLHGVSGDDKRDYDQHVANAAFIAHARSDIPWLLDQLATREAQIREAVEALNHPIPVNAFRSPPTRRGQSDE